MDDFWVDRTELAEKEAIALVDEHGRYAKDSPLTPYSVRISGLKGPMRGRAFFANDTAVLHDKIKEYLLTHKYAVRKESAD